MTTDSPVSPDGFPVLLVNDEPFSSEEAEFFLESATEEDLEMVQGGGYDFADGEGKDEGNEEDKEDEEYGIFFANVACRALSNISNHMWRDCKG